MQQRIRKVERVTARKEHKCQCKQADCQERIQEKERYIRVKLNVRDENDDFKYQTRTISSRCSWWKQYKQFFEDIIVC
jgi:hypothetical protein